MEVDTGGSEVMRETGLLQSKTQSLRHWPVLLKVFVSPLQQRVLRQPMISAKGYNFAVKSKQPRQSWKSAIFIPPAQLQKLKPETKLQVARYWEVGQVVLLLQLHVIEWCWRADLLGFFLQALAWKSSDFLSGRPALTVDLKNGLPWKCLGLVHRQKQSTKKIMKVKDVQPFGTLATSWHLYYYGVALRKMPHSLWDMLQVFCSSSCRWSNDVGEPIFLVSSYRP